MDSWKENIASVRQKLRQLSRAGCLLGGSWVVISEVISRATILIAHIRGLITLQITILTIHEPPSSVCQIREALLRKQRTIRAEGPEFKTATDINKP